MNRMAGSPRLTMAIRWNGIVTFSEFVDRAGPGQAMAAASGARLSGSTPPGSSTVR